MNKILIVDDDPTIRLLYQEELKEEGYSVITTDEFKNLMCTIAQHRPDLIVLDIKMGEVNGLDILQEIRNTYYDMPVILCSVLSAFKYDMRSIAADYYVTKGADLNELKLRIKMAFESRTKLPKSWICYAADVYHKIQSKET